MSRGSGAQGGQSRARKHAVDDETEKRIAARDSDDCPTVALALKLDSRLDPRQDHTDTRIEVFTTGDLLDALRDTGHGE